MFTGIIESLGTVASISNSGTNRIFSIRSAISNELKVDQSIAHSGVCLTVESVGDGSHQVTAIEETLKKTNLGKWTPGTLVNLERCLPMNGRLDGHLVQGHADCTAVCESLDARNGSWELKFRYPENFAKLLIEKGSIAINGISLTLFHVTRNSFTVAIIPYTWEHTNLHQLKAGDSVNIEFDMIGKYVQRFQELSQP